MEKSTSSDELTVRNQFDRICKMALKSEVTDYIRHLVYRQRYEILFSEMSKKELDQLFTMDEYNAESHCFQVLGYDIEVKSTLIAEALQTLTEKKRDVILLAYFMGMSDAEIAREAIMQTARMRDTIFLVFFIVITPLIKISVEL